MKAMILAAGLGIRLRPMTNTIPKALIELNRTPLIEIVMNRLISFGIDEVIINLHHFSDQIKGFIKQKNNFGIRIEYSFEEKLLETGGGLKKASHFFNDDRPFILHNVDIISTIDLKQMVNYHLQKDALATLAVKKRITSRYLIFDDEETLCGWRSITDNKTIISRDPIGDRHEYGFCGIHVISPNIFSKMKEKGTFSIIEMYLRLTGEGEKIVAFNTSEFDWQDLGKLEQFADYNH